MTKTTDFEALNGFPRHAITLTNWRTRPYCFWSFRHVAEMVRSARDQGSSPTQPAGACGQSGAAG
ncbi:hypothetical protein OEG84_10505 [Hoeflea sp. G2-23]|uniref:Uncharacterized protein n=1 Tax=Hoeflea algicola TaxID=2983763 RepID=A0ABT3Z8M8_9HYPH|nr:hypothetical protein [Hoeflea algicola]MCY0148130.1 hypothetical protein [Hoeflea algicola]